MSSLNRSSIAAFITLIAVLVAGCAPSTNDPESETVIGEDETVATGEDGLSGPLAVGTVLKSTTGVNLRSGPSTSNSIYYTVAQGSLVTVQQSQPQNGFYKVKHNGTVGWSYGQYYVVNESAPPPPPDGGGTSTDARTNAMSRAQSGVGFSYWWGHGRFRPEGPTSSTKGSCSGSCPDCSHGGSYGGDCSGYVAKVWQVPGTNTDLTDDEHPYSTADFNVDNSKWFTVSKSNIKRADAMVYRSGGAGHVLIYDKGDAWGSPYAYECKGCSAGCVAGYRSVSSSYHAIRKAGW